MPAVKENPNLPLGQKVCKVEMPNGDVRAYYQTLSKVGKDEKPHTSKKFAELFEARDEAAKTFNGTTKGGRPVLPSSKQDPHFGAAAFERYFGPDSALRAGGEKAEARYTLAKDYQNGILKPDAEVHTAKIGKNKIAQKDFARIETHEDAVNVFRGVLAQTKDLQRKRWGEMNFSEQQRMQERQVLSYAFGCYKREREAYMESEQAILDAADAVTIERVQKKGAKLLPETGPVPEALVAEEKVIEAAAEVESPVEETVAETTFELLPGEELLTDVDEPELG